MIDTDPRLTLVSLKVLRVFLDNPAQRLAGADLAKRCDVMSGTLYPMLCRFAAARWLDSEWEKADPKELGRPRKCFYWLTSTGLDRARAALTAIQHHG